MGPLPRLLVLAACFPCLAFAAVAVSARSSTFTHVRYNGGAIATNVEADDWHNKLTVGPHAILLALKDHQSVTILPNQVTSLSYGEEALRRVGPEIGVSVVAFRLWPFFGPYRPRRPHFHFIGINYKDGEGRAQGLLLQGNNDNFALMLSALYRVTTVPIIVSEIERRRIPSEIEVQVVTAAAKPEKL